MPRKYKSKPGSKRYKTYDEQFLKNAVKEYIDGNASLSEIAKKYEICKSVLYTRSIRTPKKRGGQTVLTAETEEYIIKYINVCAEWGYPLDSTDLRFIVKMYLDKLGISQTRFKNNLPGRDFVSSFLDRHKDKVSQRISQNIKRARAAVSPSIVKQYFQELESSLEGVPKENIINYDETNLADDPGRTKILTKRGTKYPERVMNHSKSCVSLMMAGTAAGTLLPPYVVYKSQNLYNTWVTNGPAGARYNRTSSGWFDGEMFEDWIKTIVLPFWSQKDGRKVLIGDNLSSHLSIDTIKLCKEQNISFVFLPANSTHLTQPLDVAFFRPMKTAWRAILLNWKKTDGRMESTVPKGSFPKLLRILYEKLAENATANLIAGFRKTGINPINPEEVLARLPKGNDTERTTETDKEALDQCVLALLSEMRYGTMGTKEIKTRKRKLEVIPGRSVGSECLENLEPCPGTSKEENNDESEVQVTKKNKGKGKKTKIETIQKGSTTEGTSSKNVIVQDSEEVELPLSKNKKKSKGTGKKTIKRLVEKESTMESDNTVQIGSTIEGTSSEKLITHHLEETKLPFSKEQNSEMREIENIISTNDTIFNNLKSTEQTTENSDLQLTDTDFRGINDLNIMDMPIYFEDNLGMEEVIIDNNNILDISLKDHEYPKENAPIASKNEKKIEIISDTKINLQKTALTGTLIEIRIEDKLPKPIPKEKRPSYYTNDTDILKDLMDDNII